MGLSGFYLKLHAATIKNNCEMEYLMSKQKTQDKKTLYLRHSRVLCKKEDFFAVEESNAKCIQYEFKCMCTHTWKYVCPLKQCASLSSSKHIQVRTDVKLRQIR